MALAGCSFKFLNALFFKPAAAIFSTSVIRYMVGRLHGILFKVKMSLFSRKTYRRLTDGLLKTFTSDVYAWTQDRYGLIR